MRDGSEGLGVANDEAEVQTLDYGGKKLDPPKVAVVPILPSGDVKRAILITTNQIEYMHQLLVNVGRRAIAGASAALLILGYVYSHKTAAYAAQSPWVKYVASFLLLVIVYLCFYAVLQGRGLRRYVFAYSPDTVPLFEDGDLLRTYWHTCEYHYQGLKREVRLANELWQSILMGAFLTGFCVAFYFFGAGAFLAGCVISLLYAWRQWRWLQCVRALREEYGEYSRLDRMGDIEHYDEKTMARLVWVFLGGAAALGGAFGVFS